MANIGERFVKAWNAFFSRDPTGHTPPYQSDHIENVYGNYYRPDRPRLNGNVAKSYVGMIYNRISMDVAAINFEHVKVDGDERFLEKVDDSLNRCLQFDANLDQTGRAFIQDAVMTMFNYGSVAIVPVEADQDIRYSDSYNIKALRCGPITEWAAHEVRMEIYDANKGKKDELVLPKSCVAIIENPFYTIMNRPSSTLQRLIKTINLLDKANDQNTSGKLDMIIQLPYMIRSEARKEQAEERRKSLEEQLTSSKYGIAYTDATEKIIQLNRSLENNLWTQIKDLTTQLFNELGLTSAVFDGSADEKIMLNYYSRTIDPVCAAISEEMQRKFFSKTAFTQGHRIQYFRDPFKLVPAEQLANIADSFTRNEIASSNEMRAEIGWKPASDPRADELRNKNLNADPNQEANPVLTDDGQQAQEDMSDDEGYDDYGGQ